MIHNKKQTSFILLTIVILSVSFLMGRNQHSSATAKGLSSKNAGPEHPSVVGNVSINKKNGVRTFTRNNMALQASAQQDSACGKSTMYSTQKGRLTAYMSGQAKGVIGLFDGNKT
ncbi:MAG: hypothetical protein Q8909_17745, partial [Bacteroidota bacterium]|nr:hypothetical protein [Bacteroidota bacterium]